MKHASNSANLITLPSLTKSIVPASPWDWLVRRIGMGLRLFQSKPYRSEVKKGIVGAYRQLIAKENGIIPIEINSLIDWGSIEIKLQSPTSNDGQVTRLELLCIVGLAKEFIKPGQNFLEIGTFDGNTALNVALNIDATSKVITIDLPEDTTKSAKIDYDTSLIRNINRAKKKYLHLKNVRQIYHDSTTLDFSQFFFHGAFIDGGHDYETVKSDTLNVIKYIQRPGIVLWHDYDVECEVGDLLHMLAKCYPMHWIKGTRLAVLRVEG